MKKYLKTMTIVICLVFGLSLFFTGCNEQLIEKIKNIIEQIQQDDPGGEEPGGGGGEEE